MISLAKIFTTREDFKGVLLMLFFFFLTFPSRMALLRTDGPSVCRGNTRRIFFFFLARVTRVPHSHFDRFCFLEAGEREALWGRFDVFSTDSVFCMGGAVMMTASADDIMRPLHLPLFWWRQKLL